MATGGIVISGLEFMSYRVVDIELKTLPNIAMLFTEITSESEWDFGIGFSDITFEPNDGLYIVPLAATMCLLQIDSREKRSRDNPYLSARATISGVFRFTNECTMDDELRKKMIRQQAPAIIMPYLRSTISMMLISAGFGGVTMPLINIYEMAGRNEPVNIVNVNNDSAISVKKKSIAKKNK